MNKVVERLCVFLGQCKGKYIYNKCKRENHKTELQVIIHPNVNVECGKKSIWDANGKFKMGFLINGTPIIPISNRGVLFLGENTHLETFDNVQIGPSTRLHLSKGSNVSIGANTYVLYDSVIAAKNKIKIGNNCAISWNVTITDYDWHKIKYDQKNEKRDEVVIGDHVWICSNVTILKGVSIGKNCVIGAGSVVCSDLPEDCMAVGVPARPVRHGISWEI